MLFSNCNYTNAFAYNGRTFYFTLTSIQNHYKSKRDTLTDNASRLAQFINGAVCLIVAIPGVVGSSLAEGILAVTYSFLCSALGMSNYDIVYGSYLEHKATYDTYCRSIYAYTSTSANSQRISYRDYAGLADLVVRFYHMDPSNFPAEEDFIPISSADDVAVQSPYYHNTSRILQVANTYFNRGEVFIDAIEEDPVSYWEENPAN